MWDTETCKENLEKTQKKKAYFCSVTVNRIMYGAFIYLFIFKVYIIYSREKSVKDFVNSQVTIWHDFFFFADLIKYIRAKTDRQKSWQT